MEKLKFFNINSLGAGFVQGQTYHNPKKPSRDVLNEMLHLELELLKKDEPKEPK